MTSVGLNFYNNRKEYEEDSLKIRSSNSVRLTSDLEGILKINERAWNNFRNLAPSHKKQYVLWINSAKKIETKQKRLSEAVKLLEQNKKLGMK